MDITEALKILKAQTICSLGGHASCEDCPLNGEQMDHCGKLNDDDIVKAIKVLDSSGLIKKQIRRSIEDSTIIEVMTDLECPHCGFEEKDQSNFDYLKSLVSSGKELEVNCGRCTKDYSVIFES